MLDAAGPLSRPSDTLSRKSGSAEGAVAAPEGTRGLASADTGYGVVAGVLLAAAVGFVFWRAWACDDAFITFRHVANCLAGHGPVFNVGERVQGFSHPLWFLLLLIGGLFANVYLVTIVAGLVSTVAIVVSLAMLLRREPHAMLRLLAAVAVLISSPTFVVYQTSGLENPLTNLLIVLLFGWSYRRLDGDDLRATATAAWVCSLLLWNRPDHLFICAPIVLALIVRAARSQGVRGLRVFLPAAVPLLVWYGFATLYYGSPLPNTGYAKVALPLRVAVGRGASYLHDYAVHEPGHALIIAAVLIGGAITAIRDMSARRSGARIRACFVIALWLQVAYVTSVGGDFMRGRFLVSTLVASVALGMHLLSRIRPSGISGRLVTSMLAAVLVCVCAEVIGSVHLPAAWRFGCRSLQEQAFYHPFRVIGMAVLLGTLVIAGLVALRRVRASRRGQRVFAIAAWLGGLYVVAAVGQRDPPWAAVLLPACALGIAAYLLGLLAGGGLLRGPVTLTAIVVLAAAVSSLCDMDPWGDPVDPRSGISDEYKCFAEAWNRNRFRMPTGRGNGAVRTLVQQGERAARYARAHGPIAMEFGSIGFAAYYAGPNVHVIDRFGLTDAFIARLPANPASRVGHMQRDIPGGYLSSRGVVNRLPDWANRLRRLDPTLAADARAGMSDARWEDPAARDRWQRVRRIISGEILSRGRLSDIPGYALCLW